MEHTKEEILLNEENETRIKVGKNTSINGNPRESDIAQYFIQYGGLEYIHERPTYAIVCFMEVDSAQQAYLGENEKGNKVTLPTPQTWDANRSPYLESDMCHRRGSEQFLNFSASTSMSGRSYENAKTKNKAVPWDKHQMRR